MINVVCRTLQIIPAQRGWCVVVFTVDGGGPGYDVHPIIAWALIECSGEDTRWRFMRPITAESLRCGGGEDRGHDYGSQEWHLLSHEERVAPPGTGPDTLDRWARQYVGYRSTPTPS